MALRGKAEALQRLGIDLEDDRLGLTEKTELHRRLQIGLVGHLVEPFLRLELMMPEAAMFDIALELVLVRRAPAVLVAIFATPAGKRPAGEPGRRAITDLTRAFRVDQDGRSVAPAERFAAEARALRRSLGSAACVRFLGWLKEEASILGK